MASVDPLKATLKRLENERLTVLAQLDDISQDSTEHKLVLKNLAKLPNDRRCYRILGGIAIEKTVDEIKPDLNAHATRVICTIIYSVTLYTRT
ncbi:uncharacterized protein TOT_040000956 [Theileria orientalis strain Shintoku]|uniref:Prefoldin subunit 2 n=1 Tax=Theileria orientalis strain Shintoku TaxID=869250 RepID=J4DQ96_THEOR|nr:uncharacterized protein TOT_040000956 [Theileria orientalis strain Shintoku]PVC50856.1 hypothetical protein MACL_00001945 [Theileria orientalis]BAM42069.1 uncharacterized protein TOT_040000956 [Theileria orientalis strain Shintoku]|eukprot:XP_009692370.1 uncharacterized protein TOT_040000956 [Theileria orientalis strain Shintoku]